MKKLTIRTPKKGADWRPKFLELLREFGVVSYACSGAGVSRTTAYKYRNQSEVFAAEWDSAIEDSIDAMEREARKRAMSKSDTLMIFLLKAQRPEKYQERYRLEHAGSEGHPIAVELRWPEDEGDDAVASSGPGSG